MSAAAINAATVLSRSAELPQAELGPDDTVLLDADHGVYYGLEGPARAIWDMLASDLTFGQVCDRLIEMYDVDAETCRRDTLAFVEQLVENGLVTAR